MWAIAKDGAVFYRGSVSPQNPAGQSYMQLQRLKEENKVNVVGVQHLHSDPSAGECWYHIPSPLRQTLRQLSVGRTSVFAVDENSKSECPSAPWTERILMKCDSCLTGNLWYRQGLTPSYPQGSAWELISNNVTKVSVGPLDQVSVAPTSGRRRLEGKNCV